MRCNNFLLPANAATQSVEDRDDELVSRRQPRKAASRKTPRQRGSTYNAHAGTWRACAIKVALMRSRGLRVIRDRLRVCVCVSVHVAFRKFVCT